MDVVDRVIDYLNRVPGIVKVFRMDDRLAKEVDDIEKSICTSSSHNYRNLGFDDAMDRKYRICVLHTQDHFFQKRALVKLRTTDGTVMGTTLYPYQIPAFKRMDNVIWLSEDFVVFTNVHGRGEEEFVVTSFDLPEISRAVPECTGVIGASPAMSSDILLKTEADIPLTDNIFSTIIGFDDSRVRSMLFSLSPMLWRENRMGDNMALASVDRLMPAVSNFNIH